MKLLIGNSTNGGLYMRQPGPEERWANDCLVEVPNTAWEEYQRFLAMRDEWQTKIRSFINEGPR